MRFNALPATLEMKIRRTPEFRAKPSVLRIFLVDVVLVARQVAFKLLDALFV